MQKVYWITGFKGFIGKHLSRHFLAKGVSVIHVQATESNLVLYSPITKKFVELLWNSHPSILQDFTPSHVLHFGAKGVGTPGDSEIHYKNFQLSLKLAKFICKLDNPVRVLFAGTIDEYGGENFPNENHSIKERLLTPYALYKYKSGEVISDTFHGSIHEFVHMRICNIFGEGQRVTTLLHSVLNPAVETLKINNLNYFRDLMWVEDLVQNVYLLSQIQYPGRLINVGSGRSVLMREFVEATWRSQGKVASDLVIPDSPQNFTGQSKPHMNIDLVSRLLGRTYVNTGLNKFLKTIGKSRGTLIH